MVLIVGWGGGKAEDLGEIAPVTCPNCHNEVFLHHIRSQKRVSLFFVPIAPYGTDEYLACPVCRHGLEVKQEHRAAVGEMRMATRAFRGGVIPRDHYAIKVDRFWRTLGVAPSGRQVVHPPPTIPPAARSTTPSIAGELQELGRLHASGVLTDDEFAVAKRSVLRG